MNTRTQKTIGKIFLQYTIALVVFTGLGVVAQANATETKAQTNISALFDSKAAVDAKRFLASQNGQFSAKEVALAEQVDLSFYKLQDATKHLYAKNVRVDAKETESVWPLLSLNVQQGDLNVKLGSQYQR